jgi:hypothetical protein
VSGLIHPEVQPYINMLPIQERRVLNPFLEAGFDITYARPYKWSRAELTIFFLKPDASLAANYGFRDEIVLSYSAFTRLHNSTFQAVSRFLDLQPANGRVEPLFYFLCTKDPNTVATSREYNLLHNQDRIAIPLVSDELASDNASAWTVKNALQHHYYSLDRYNEKLPLKEDTYFFGRKHEIGVLQQVYARGENFGVFGLRKTGKTSLLFKLQRQMQRKDSVTIYVDALKEYIRRMRWYELLKYMADQMLQAAVGAPAQFDFSEGSAALSFEHTVAEVRASGKVKRVVFFIDEIEWISPGTARDEHWNDDFLPFWHTIRSIQSTDRTLGMVIAGVNPSMIETAKFGGSQNPLFSIVQPVYVAGLTEPACDEMVQEIGKLVGVRFTGEALDYLFDEYGGHPLLTRLACSYLVDEAKRREEIFPLLVDRDLLRSEAEARDRWLLPYAVHLVHELEQFYPEEYLLLETLATGDYFTFVKQARNSVQASHLFRYGIVTSHESPYITYKVVDKFVASENARREGRTTNRKLIAEAGRQAYVDARVRSIIDDMRQLEAAVRQDSSKPVLFGPGGFPEADRLSHIRAPHDATSFGAALTPLQRSFYEAVVSHGESLEPPNRNYFHGEVRAKYPDLYDALNRIRLYRLNAEHYALYTNVAVDCGRYLDRDLLHNEMVESNERYWFLFEICLDELLKAIQLELVRR